MAEGPPEDRANELIKLWTETHDVAMAALKEARDTNRRVDWLIRRLIAAGAISVDRATGAPGGSMPAVRAVARRAGSAVKSAAKMVEDLRRAFNRPP